MKNRFLAYISPLFLFLAFLPLAEVFKWDHPYAVWWKSSPEQWIYPLQCFCVFLCLFHFRKSYQFLWKSPLFSIFIGVLGGVIWIIPSFLYDLDNAFFNRWEFFKYFGVGERKEGFNPFIFEGWEFSFSILLRCLRAILIVPFVEEIFWRGFLSGYLEKDIKWKSFSLKESSWKSYFGVTLFFMLIHQPVDFFVAWIYGTLIFFLSKRTGSMASAILAHAISNLVLVAYILKTKNYGLW